MRVTLGGSIDYRKPAAITTAALMAGLAVSQPAVDEHTHDGEAAPAELIVHSGFSASGGFTNTAAAVIEWSTSYSWSLPSSSVTFERDVDFASRMRCVGITVYVLPPAG